VLPCSHVRKCKLVKWRGIQHRPVHHRQANVRACLGEDRINRLASKQLGFPPCGFARIARVLQASPSGRREPSTQSPWSNSPRRCLFVRSKQTSQVTTPLGCCSIPSRRMWSIPSQSLNHPQSSPLPELLLAAFFELCLSFIFLLPAASAFAKRSILSTCPGFVSFGTVSWPSSWIKACNLRKHAVALSACLRESSAWMIRAEFLGAW
jgi:hypothetical protein